MAKLLHINSSVRNQGSVSRQLTGEFIDKWKESRPDAEVTVRDLAAHPIPHLNEQMMGAFFTPGEKRTPEQLEAVKISDRLVEELLAADTIVIGAPMYNFAIPSSLKAWIDRIAVRGRTFRYTADGPEGLARDKRVIVVASAGGIHDGQPSDFVEPYLRHVFASMMIASGTVTTSVACTRPSSSLSRTAEMTTSPPRTASPPMCSARAATVRGDRASKNLGSGMARLRIAAGPEPSCG